MGVDPIPPPEPPRGVVKPRKLFGAIQLRLRGADGGLGFGLSDGLAHGIHDFTPANCSSIALSQ
ncbi:MAG TPA: hypothetical protein VMB73_15490 [Acetobacteraceae bacterium]|nr:hypothetical protein [Acetobacteraceae bacterium]